MADGYIYIYIDIIYIYIHIYISNMANYIGWLLMVIEVVLKDMAWLKWFMISPNCDKNMVILAILSI